MDLNNWTRMRLLQKVDFDSASLAGDGVLVVVQECGTVAPFGRARPGLGHGPLISDGWEEVLSQPFFTTVTLY